MQKQKETPAGIFINGKAQIIEMLQIMPESEKEKLLQKIKVRNPTLANELMEESFTFEQIDQLSDTHLSIVLNNTNATICGIALKSTSVDFQRRILSIAPREYAKEAYQTLKKPIANELTVVPKAQNKIINTVVALIKKKIIRI